jgi:hypothetical protein
MEPTRRLTSQEIETAVFAGSGFTWRRTESCYTPLSNTGSRGRLMPKKRAFISFDYDNDQGAKVMLAGQAKYPDTPFDFTDASVKDHLTGDWKEKVKRRLKNIDVMIVLCGVSTNTATGVAAELKLAQELGLEYFLLRAYNDKVCVAPVSTKPTDKIYNWTWDNLKLLIAGRR